jgi:hypothetical protein
VGVRRRFPLVKVSGQGELVVGVFGKSARIANEKSSAAWKNVANRYLENENARVSMILEICRGGQRESTIRNYLGRPCRMESISF